ncbi:MAG: hypothetical protein P8M70_10010, partial [Verrucomicrobiota bacterium]|nr:hypothetical protein [Verrucomicrobiota bacterium]
MKINQIVKNNRMLLQVLSGLLLVAGGVLGSDEEKPDLAPLISQSGELIFKDDFEKKKIRPEWKSLHGTHWEIVEGTLRGEPSTKEYQQEQVAKGNKIHSGRTPSSRLMVSADDCIMLFRFKLAEGLSGAHFGFNDGSFKTGTGHVCRFTVSNRKGLTLQKDKNAKLKGDTDKTLVTSKFNLKADTWYWMMLEIVGEQMAAQVSGGPVLKAQHARIDIPKDQINLPTRGGGVIHYDHVRVWKALPPSPSK